MTPGQAPRGRRRRPPGAARPGADRVETRPPGSPRNGPGRGRRRRSRSGLRPSAHVGGPALGRERNAHRLGGATRVVGHARRARPHVAGAGPLRARAARWPGPGHAGRAGHHPAGRLPLVSVGRAGRQPGGRVGAGHPPGAGRRSSRGRCRPPRRRRPAARPGAEQQARLGRGEGHRAPRRGDAAGGDAGQAVDPGGDVDGQDRHVAGVERPPRAPVHEAGAVGGVDHQVGRRPGRRGRAARSGRHDPDAGPGGGQPAGGDPAVVAVVALAGHDERPAARRSRPAAAGRRGRRPRRPARSAPRPARAPPRRWPPSPRG